MSRSVLWVLLLASSALVALLGYQLMQVRGMLDDAYEAASRPQVDSWIPNYPTSTLDDGKITLGRDGATQVLYFFSPECPYCKASAPEVRDLHARLQREFSTDIEFIGIGSGDTNLLAEDAKTQGFTFPIAEITPKLADLFKVQQVPLLLLVGPDGRVHYSKVGVFTNKDDATTLMAALAHTDVGFSAE